MKNTGDIGLTLPLLPGEWRWTVKYEVTNLHNTREGWDEAIITPIAFHEDGTTVAGMYVCVDRCDDYDHLVRAVQAEVDALADRISNWGKEELSKDDAVDTILAVFNQGPGRVMSAKEVRRYNLLKDIEDNDTMFKGEVTE